MPRFVILRGPETPFGKGLLDKETAFSGRASILKIIRATRVLAAIRVMAGIRDSYGLGWPVE